jgi:alkanesulfonate monooxygenase SsuD/methylene tetrahydromethanopterin reductase-like flavin-dependent oxidoreductase (luciferase family)
MLDEALEILQAAWSGELVVHRGEHYTVDSMRFLPRPVQRPGVPIWVAGYYGKPRPLRRAARYQGFFPINLEHPDQLAEISAELRRLGRETKDGAAEPFDIAVELDPGSDPAPYAAAGATCGLVAFPVESGVGRPDPRCDPRGTGATVEAGTVELLFGRRRTSASTRVR